MSRLPFKDRCEAGRVLARELKHYRNQRDTAVLALPRGGVPVGFEVARFLDAPLDIFLVRKLGVPGQEELALGAIASGGVRVINNDVLQMTGITENVIDAIARREQQELQRREREYRDGRTAIPLQGCVAILVDDGLATGATMLAACRSVRQLEPRKVVVAVPVAAAETCTAFRSEVDEIVCAETPDPFRAVGLWYDDFSQTTDEQVRDLLGRAVRHSVR